jgi:hypothetical protein
MTRQKIEVVIAVAEINKSHVCSHKHQKNETVTEKEKKKNLNCQS